MEERTIVWAYKPVQALHYKTGIVECDKELADLLIAEGEVQDLRVGAAHLKPVDTEPVQSYMTRHMIPEHLYRGNPDEPQDKESVQPATSGPRAKHRGRR